MNPTQRAILCITERLPNLDDISPSEFLKQVNDELCQQGCAAATTVDELFHRVGGDPASATSATKKDRKHKGSPIAAQLAQLAVTPPTPAPPGGHACKTSHTTTQSPTEKQIQATTVFSSTCAAKTPAAPQAAAAAQATVALTPPLTFSVGDWLAYHQARLAQHPDYVPSGAEARLDKRRNSQNRTHIFVRIDSAEGPRIVAARLLNTLDYQRLTWAGISKSQIADFPTRQKHARSPSGSKRLGYYLGKGSLGTVKFAEIEGRLCVVKKVLETNALYQDAEAQAGEARAQQMAGTDVTVPFYGQTHTVNKEGRHVVMSFMDIGEGREGFDHILDLIHRDQSRRSPKQLLELTLAVARKLQIMHRNGVAHRDLKWENTLISDADVKIIDFGFSSLAGANGEIQGESCLTSIPAYRAPEEIHLIGHSSPFDAPKADIWGLGCMLLLAFSECSHGHTHFVNRGFSRVHFPDTDALQAEVNRALAYHQFLPPLLKPLILSMLRVDPDARVNLSEAIATLEKTLRKL